MSTNGTMGGKRRVYGAEPVRPGDRFKYADGRIATVISTRPGGYALIRIESSSKPSLVVGEHPIGDLKKMPRVGKVSPVDGFFPFSLNTDVPLISPCLCGGATCSDEVGDAFRIICQVCGASGPEHAVFWEAVHGWNIKARAAIARAEGEGHE